jgi:hypothetical protein
LIDYIQNGKHFNLYPMQILAKAVIMSRVGLRGKPAWQLPGCQPIKGAETLIVEQIFKEYRFQGAPNY